MAYVQRSSETWSNKKGGTCPHSVRNTPWHRWSCSAALLGLPIDPLGGSVLGTHPLLLGQDRVEVDPFERVS